MGPNRRIEAARVLRDEVERTTRDCGGTLVIGDFNEEPYTENVTWNLRSSRERSQVIDGRATFYNPFWRHQGELDASDQPMRSWRGPGTLRLSSAQDELTRWKLVDFALVDRELLLGSSGWHLIESSAKIVSLEESIFGDHLPIMLTASYVGDPKVEASDDVR
jgi:endonuclease/exonuclease/phosphatase family metal-dependent hydrolase